MKRYLIYMIPHLLSYLLIILGSCLLFGVDKNSGNAIFSIMSERVHEYNGMLVNKFPVFQFNPELFGMVFLALGFLIIVEAIFKKLNN